LEACKIIDAETVFLGQIDGSCEITADRYVKMFDFLKNEKPDMVFTQVIMKYKIKEEPECHRIY
jgi:hypothetical protein